MYLELLLSVYGKFGKFSHNYGCFDVKVTLDFTAFVADESLASPQNSRRSCGHHATPGLLVFSLAVGNTSSNNAIKAKASKGLFRWISVMMALIASEIRI